MKVPVTVWKTGNVDIFINGILDNPAGGQFFFCSIQEKTDEYAQALATFRERDVRNLWIRRGFTSENVVQLKE